MSGIKLDNFSTSDINLTAIMSTAQAMRNGHFALSLTEMDSTTIPQIAAGSIIDLNGQLIYFDADETIGGTPVDGVTYIKLIYSSGTVTAEWTATAPAFDTSKNGWYGTGGSSGHRYVARMIKASTSYSGKVLYDKFPDNYLYESKYNYTAESWTGGQNKTKTIVFSSDIKYITFFSIGDGTLQLSVDSVTISGDTLSVSLTNRSVSTITFYLTISATAAL